MSWSRGEFFKALSLLPLAGLGLPGLRRDSGPPRVQVTGDPYSRYEPWVEIYPEHVRHNVREIHRAVGGRPITAVIKNNGYGMGVVNAAWALEGLDPVEAVAVVKLSEALALRDAGITKPVILLSPVHGEELEEVARREIVPMVYTPQGQELERIAARTDRPMAVEVKVDTGLGRLGVRREEATEVYGDLNDRPGVRIRGSFITLTESEDFDREVIDRYSALLDRLEQDGFDVGDRHAVSTTPIFRHPEAYFDRVRPGMGLYGVYPQPETQRAQDLMDLRPALALKCRVLQVKRLEAGETAGYGQAFEAEGPTWLATLPVGHADGWQRDAAGCAEVRINGRHHPVVASVSASHTLVDLGDDTDVRAGDEAVVFDHEEGSRPDDIHRACGVSTYDLLMHLSPALPRHVME